MPSFFRRPQATVTEGTPVHDVGAYYHAGRGGAGNCKRLTEDAYGSTKPLHKTSSAVSSTSQNQHFFGGRGGAGNAHPTSERAIFSFDEELERDRIFHEHHAPVYSVGRGGAGNIVPANEVATRGAYVGSPEQDGGVLTPRTSVGSDRSKISDKSAMSASESLWRSLTRVRSNE